MNNDLATLPALSPTAVHNAITKQTFIVRGVGTWGDSIHWGDSAVFGNIVFSRAATFSAVLALDDSVLWGDSVIWGQDDSVLWGDTVNATSSPSAFSADGGDK